MDEPKIEVVKVQMHDTGLGIEAGYKNDEELIEAAKAHRAELRKLLSPQALKALEDMEADSAARFLLGADPKPSSPATESS